jgi:hypothetical protein
MGPRKIPTGTPARSGKAVARRTARAGDPATLSPASVAGAASRLEGLPSPEDIARRAYDLFLARGERHGDDLSDWFQAERELTAGNQSGRGREH